LVLEAAFRLVRREAEDFRAMNSEMGERARQSNSPTGRVNAHRRSARCASPNRKEFYADAC